MHDVRATGCISRCPVHESHAMYFVCNVLPCNVFHVQYMSFAYNLLRIFVSRGVHDHRRSSEILDWTRPTA
jgi:hypothetical protein